jgi:hypothetical protein
MVTNRQLFTDRAAAASGLRGLPPLLLATIPHMRPTMRKVFAALASLCVFLSLAGSWENMRMIRAGANLPADEAARQAYIVGLFVPAALLLVVALVFVFLALRRR